MVSKLNKNRFGKNKKKYNKLGNIFSLAVFFSFLIFFYISINNLSQSNEYEALEITQRAISRAAIQFYAIEGRFPPTLEYLKERFNLQLDTERFIIQYHAFASNIMPEIVVILR